MDWTLDWILDCSLTKVAIKVSKMRETVQKLGCGLG